MMKKVLFFAGLAAAVLSLAGCNRETEFFGRNGRKMQIVLTDAATRTVNDGLATKWVDGDALNVFYAPAGTTEYSENTKFEVDDAASNHATGTATLTADAYDWYLLYPYSKYIKTPANPSDGYIPIGCKSNEVQTQTGLNSTAHLAGANLPVWGVAKNVAVDAVPTVTMKHVVSVVKVNVTNGLDKAITISNVAFTGTEDVVGTYYVDFSGETPTFTGSGDSYVSSTANLAVSGAEPLASGATASFYLAIKPFTAPANGELAVKVVADAGSFEKKIELDKETEFCPGYIKTLNVTYSSAEELPTLTIADIKDMVKDATSSSNAVSFEGKLNGAIVTFVSGRYAFIQDETAGIVFYNNTNPFSAGQKLEGIVSGSGYAFNGLKEVTSLTVETITPDQDIPASVELSLAELNADYDRYESVRVTVKGVTVPADFVNRNTTMTDGDETLALRDQVKDLSVTPGKYDITGYPSYYNDPQFGVWAQDDIISVGTVNIFDVTPSQINVAASATTATINVTGNVDWTADASDGASVDPASGSGEGTITVSFPANEDPENTKEYTVFVRTEAEGVNDEFEVNITQGKAVAGNYFVKVTAAADLEDGLYLIVNEKAGVALKDAVDETSNGLAVTISGGTVEATAEVKAVAFTFTASNGAFQGANGKYLAHSGTRNSINPTDTPSANTVTFDAGNAVITAEDAYFIQYNKSSGQERFRYFKNPQTDGEVQLYKLSEGVTPPPAATLESIAVSGQQTVFTVGDTFTFDGKVTASYSDGTTKDVTASAKVSTPDLSAAGTQEVTVSYTENDVTKTAKYSITVKVATAHAGTLEDPYTVADALAAAEALGEGKTSNDKYYVKGLVSEAPAAVSNGKATYFISDDGTATGKMKVYNGYYIGNSSFTSADQLQAGDDVVVYGKLQYYKPSSGDSELEISSSYIHSLKRGGAEQYAFSATASTDRVSSAASTVKINVYGNVDWTAGVTSPGTIDVSTGNGIGTITVSIPENTSTTNEKIVIVTVARLGTDEKLVFTIYQDKKDASGAVTITGTSAASAGMTETRGEQQCTVDGVTFVITDGIVSGDQIRIYKNASITISAPSGKNLKKVVFTCTASGENQYGPGCFAAHDGYSFADTVGTWEGSANSLTLTASSAQVRATSIVVTLE